MIPTGLVNLFFRDIDCRHQAQNGLVRAIDQQVLRAALIDDLRAGSTGHRIAAESRAVITGLLGSFNFYRINFR